MNDILGKILPLLFLIAFGHYIGRKNFFGDEGFSKLQNFILNTALPCVLFSTFFSMEIEFSYLWVSTAFFVLMVLLFSLGFITAKVLHIKDVFFPYYTTTFGFGTMALPFFATLYGSENLKYISILGVGHEIFVAAIYFPLAQQLIAGKKFSVKTLGDALRSPFLIMTGAGLVLNISGLNDVMMLSAIGQGIVGTIGRIGSLSLTLTLIIVGYRLKFSNRNSLSRSLKFLAIRLVIVISVSLAFKQLVINQLIDPSPMFNAAYYILIWQHSSVTITMIVGQNCSAQEHELAINTFVLSALAGILFFVIYAFVSPPLV